MDKKIKFMFRAAVVTAALSAIAFVILGSTAPVEAGMSLFGHWLKTFFLYCWVTVILETFVYVLGQVAYHWVDGYKDLYGKHWFIEGIKDDWRSFKAKVTWKKVLKYVLIYVGFFAACFVIVGVLEYFVP
jgi:hypothetical protein